MSIGREGMPQMRDSVSIWSIYVPYGVDRQVYIDNCYKTGTVTLINENSEVINRVKIGKLLLQLVEFPDDTDSLGSEVICLTIPYSGEIRVVDVYYTDKQYNFQKENEYRFVKQHNTGIASITVDGRGRTIISVDGGEDVGEIILNVTDNNKTGKLSIQVNGSVNLVSSQSVLIDSPQIFLNQSEEPIPLGNKLAQLLDDILSQLAKESAGPYPLLGRSIYEQLKESIEAIKSTMSFVK